MELPQKMPRIVKASNGFFGSYKRLSCVDIKNNTGFKKNKKKSRATKNL